MSLLEVRGREWVRLSRRRREALVTAAFDYWRAHGFPHYRLTRAELARDFRALQAQPTGAGFRQEGVIGSMLGIRVANVFHPHMWSVPVSRYRTPMDVFADDQLLKAALRRAWMVWPDRRGASESCLRRMLKTYPGTASVSNFRPTVARAIIERFTRPGQLVVDFSAGFGGRLVGCLSLNRRYVGIEPSARQSTGLRRTIRALERLTLAQMGASILRGCAEDLIGQWTREPADLVFSSPPYYDWERYSRHPSQSYRRYRTHEQWIGCFLGPVIEHSAQVLGRHGRLVLNVSAGRRIPSPEVAEALAKRVGLQLELRIPLLLSRVPYLHPRRGPYKRELLLVFRRSRSSR